MNNIRLLIVDDHPLFRQGLIDLLSGDPNLEVVGQAADAETAYELAKRLYPDVVLMDVNLPGANGLNVTRKLYSAMPNIRTIIITGYDDVEQVLHSLRAGAAAYCPKDTPPEALIRTIYAVAAGRYVIGQQEFAHDEVQTWLEEQIGAWDGFMVADSEDAFTPLSPREMEILECVTNGLSNKEIAYRLGISHQTVKNHMTAVLRKMGVEDRTQAAVYALNHGWVRVDDLVKHVQDGVLSGRAAQLALR